MKKYIGIFMVLSLVAFMGSYCFAADSAKGQAVKLENLRLSGKTEAGIRVIKIKASKHSFEPEQIVVRLGEKLRLVVTSVDVNHQLAISEFKVNLIVPAGKTESVEFIADKKGTFQSSCSYYYGDKPAYYFMHINLIVK